MTNYDKYLLLGLTSRAVQFLTRLVPMKTVKLKKKEDRRILRGHPWIFSNELERLPGDVQPGELVDVLDHTGKFVARGYCNPTRSSPCAS
jgi:hypothetical protein